MRLNLLLITWIGWLALALPSQGQIHEFDIGRFRKADSLAALFPGHSLSDLRNLSAGLTSSLTTEEEKFRSIYKWVCLNIENDYNLFIENKKKRERLTDPAELEAWNQAFGTRAMKSLVRNHRTVCTGYAALVQAMAQYAGISCEIVNGYGRTIQANVEGSARANHSWNAVRLNNKWYLCDPTWSSGAFDAETDDYLKKFNEAYFLPDPALFAGNHYPLDTTWLLFDNAPTLDQFLSAPISYSGSIKYGIEALAPTLMNIEISRGETVQFSFTSRFKDPMKIEVLVGTTVRRVNIKSEPIGPVTKHMFEHVFNRSGSLPVHILVNGTYVLTCQVTAR
jgi:hypothetical protein